MGYFLSTVNDVRAGEGTSWLRRDQSRALCTEAAAPSICNNFKLSVRYRSTIGVQHAVNQAGLWWNFSGVRGFGRCALHHGRESVLSEIVLLLLAILLYWILLPRFR